MVPQKLQLQNFLSYRDETVNLRGIDLAVIAGDNGAGKSAILEAIVYAVWGEGRKGDGQTKPDNTLINRTAEAEEDATEMAVTYDFTLQQSGEAVSHTIKRSYRKTASGKTTTSELEFYVRDKELTSGTLKETQALIDERVGLSYELFTATSLFQQGQWDNLLQMTAGERKDVFFNLLQLDQYADLKERARGKYREFEDKITGLTHEREQLQDKTLDPEDTKAKRKYFQEKRRDLTALIKALQENQAAQNNLQTLKDKRSEAKQAWAKKKARVRELSKQHDQIQRKIKTLKDELSDDLPAEDELKERRATLNDKLAVLKEEQQMERHKHDRFLKLRDIVNEVEQAAESKAVELERSQEIAEARAEDIDQSRREIAARWAHLGWLQYDLWTLEPEFIDEDIADQKDRLEEIRDFIAEEKAIRDAETEAIEQLQGAKGDGFCPTCGAELTPEQREQIIEDAESEIRAAENALDNLGNDLERAQDEMDLLRGVKERIGELQRAIENEQASIIKTVHDIRMWAEERQVHQVDEDLIRSLRDYEAEAIAEVVDHDQAEEYAELNNNLNSLRDEGFTRTFTSSVEDEIETFRQKKQGVQDQLSTLREQEQIKKRIADAEDRLTELESAGEEAREEADEAETVFDEAVEAAAEAEEAIRSVEELIDEHGFSKHVSDLASAKEAKSNVTDRMAELKAEIKQINERAERLAEVDELLDEVQKKSDAAMHLVDAFGRDGVPRMLLERALPAIENQANFLLQDLDTNLRVSFRTEREKKSGGRTSTFDIQVRAGSSVMPYQALSGGQKFRVTLAVRLALSQYLSARSGQPVETLIIDEGFGTLDEEGRLSAQRAIAKASEDFALVLVITHIAEFRDAFPQKIDVERTIEGSHATVHA